jgi:hypothetical protein
LVIEEVRYDFADHPKYADSFVRNLMRLMILSKLNSSARSAVSKAFFLEVISEINGCEAYIVNYGQPLLYAKYAGVSFTDQKVGCQFVRINEYIIEVTVESILADSAKTFDSIASSSQSQIKWGIAESEQGQVNPLFRLLDVFIDSVARVSSLPRSSPDSIRGRRFTIRNAIVVKKSLDVEFLVDGELNILQMNPMRKKRDSAVSLLMSSSDAAKAILALMIQT